jgi:hypothetical protein
MEQMFLAIENLRLSGKNNLENQLFLPAPGKQ